MSYQNFQMSLKIANKTEIKVATKLSELLNCTISHYNDNKLYDFELVKEDGESTKFEVKEDFMAVRTGNVAIEYESRGKESGCKASIANFFVYVISKVMYIITKDSINNLCDCKDYRKVNGGDKGSNTLMTLVPFEMFKKECRKIIEL